ncbi:outer membrane protein [Rhodopseudomonas palustris]|uniref:outer membrane protein n=1 Tax=Rhodopseudomonas palustris TaxID=1076 RepID=UPI0032DE86F8
MAAAVGVMAQTAYAADMPDYGPLRGALMETPRVVNWDGFYVGGQVGYGTADMNFGNSTKSMLRDLLNNVDLEEQYKISDWPVLGKTTSQGSLGYGGFAGYNFQWSDIVLGAEVSYLHSEFSGEYSGAQARRFAYPKDYYSDAAVSANASMRITDLGSLRLRAGYATGDFLPYVFGGVAGGRADIYRAVTSDLNYQYVGSQVPALPSWNPAPNSSVSNQKGQFIYGYSAGLGFDMMLSRGVFLRAEWEYLRFTSPVDVSVNSVRGGLGYKF